MSSIVRAKEQEDAAVNFASWDAAQLGDYFAKSGLGDYREMFIKHKISGRLAPLLTDNDLKDMGITIVGDRLRIASLISVMQRKVRYDTRTKVYWEGVERLYFSDAEKCCYTCCGCFPDDPSTYKITYSHLKIKTVNPARCGPIQLCCCNEYSVNNVDFSKIDDVDVVGVPSPCCARVFCCAPGKDIIEITTKTAKEGKVSLVLVSGQGDHVSGLIMNQVEEAQKIERE